MKKNRVHTVPFAQIERCKLAKELKGPDSDFRQMPPCQDTHARESLTDPMYVQQKHTQPLLLPSCDCWKHAVMRPRSN